MLDPLDQPGAMIDQQQETKSSQADETLWTGTLALDVCTIAPVALAHPGATGVVLDRKNVMTAMRDTIAELAPMLQVKIPHDTFIGSEGAGVMAGHAGEIMLSLFPENSLEGVTSAKPEIWSDRQQFAALSVDKKMYADAFTEAAPNGFEPAAPPPGAMAGLDDTAMAMAESTDRARAFTVADLMGYGESAERILARRATSDRAPLALDLTTLAAVVLFNRVSATCSSCHAQFRAGRT